LLGCGATFVCRALRLNGALLALLLLRLGLLWLCLLLPLLGCAPAFSRPLLQLRLGLLLGLPGLCLQRRLALAWLALWLGLLPAVRRLTGGRWGLWTTLLRCARRLVTEPAALAGRERLCRGNAIGSTHSALRRLQGRTWAEVATAEILRPDLHRSL